MKTKKIKTKIRNIKDWPRKGVDFKDITPLLQDRESFREVINIIVKKCNGQRIDKVVGIDARGFLLASPVAYQMNAGLAIVRKPGKLPYKTIEREYCLEYGENTIQMHVDAISSGEKVVLVDDVVATGGTALATCELIERLGGKLLATVFLIDLPFLGGSEKLKKKGYTVKSLIQYND